MEIYTIGHSNSKPDDAIYKLLSHGVTCIADVRSRPFSRFVPAYNRNTFHAMSVMSGIDYYWEGEALGGMTDLSVYSEKFQVAMFFNRDAFFC